MRAFAFALVVGGPVDGRPNRIGRFHEHAFEFHERRFQGQVGVALAGDERSRPPFGSRSNKAAGSRTASAYSSGNQRRGADFPSCRRSSPERWRAWSPPGRLVDPQALKRRIPRLKKTSAKSFSECGRERRRLCRLHATRHGGHQKSRPTGERTPVHPRNTGPARKITDSMRTATFIPGPAASVEV